jgi:hypothetical protein
MTAEPPTRFDAFLSYAREDEDRIGPVQRALEQLNVRVWRDTGQIRPGDIWLKNIEIGLRQSDCVVLFNSQHALASEWVRREWNVALALNKRIVPVRLDDDAIPLLLTTIEFIDMRESTEFPMLIQHIVSGIRASMMTSPIPEPEVLTNPSVIGQDVTILQRMIQSERRKGHNLTLSQWSVVFLGLAAVTALMSFGGTQTRWIVTVTAVTPLAISGAILWVITALLRSSHSTVLRLTSIKDGIELYCPKQQQCLEFRAALEKLLKDGAGIREDVG